MKIKNTEQLRLRARGHARADHIKQGTYGQARLNGHADFRGCVIGCLSTPHRKRELEKFLTEIFDFRHTRWTSIEEEGGYSSETQIEILAEEFGIDPDLANAAEVHFERHCPTHGAAIEFVKEFAEALQEGAEIDTSNIPRTDSPRAFLAELREIPPVQPLKQPTPA